MSVDRAAIEWHLSTMFGDTEGWIFTPTLVDQSRNKNGKHEGRWSEGSAMYWPRQRSEIVERIAQAGEAGADCYYTPGLRTAPTRRDGAPGEREAEHCPVVTLWADDDDGRQPERVGALVDGGAWTTFSYDAVRRHVYVPLAEPLAPDLAAVYQRRLCAWLEADPAIARLNSVLRPAGTLNHKPRTASEGSAALVVVDDEPNGKRWSIDELDLLLPSAADVGEVAPIGIAEAEPLPDWLEAGIDPLDSDRLIFVDRLREKIGADRSAQTARMVTAAVRAGLNDGQIVEAAASHAPTVDKYGPAGRKRHDKQVAEMTDKARRYVAERAEQGQVMTADTSVFAGIDGHRYTEMGNADRLVAQHGEVIRYVPRWGSWLAWDGRRWKLDHDGVRTTELAKDVPRQLLARIGEVDDLEERKRLLAWVNASEKASGLSSLVRLARATPSVAVEHDRLDAKRFRLTIANGDLDLETGTLDDHDPDRLSTKLADVRHDSTATAPMFEKFLEQILPDPDVRAYMQRFAGYCLTGSVAEQMIGIWYGAGANGKSTLINIERAMLGDYAAIAKRELLVASNSEQHPTALVDLFGARLATCVELREGAALDEARVKALTGGDTVAARRMREDWWHFEPTHKLVVATNHKPTIRADDPATWRRVHLVPFEVVIPPDQIDRTLGDRIIATELPGVLNWALRGLADWRENGLQAPERVKYATAEYRADADTVARFMADEEITLEAGATCGSRELREIHERWCDDNGENPRSHWQAVQRRLKELGATPGRSASYRFWRGITAVEMTRDDAP